MTVVCLSIFWFSTLSKPLARDPHPQPSSCPQPPSESNAVLSPPQLQVPWDPARVYQGFDHNIHFVPAHSAQLLSCLWDLCMSELTWSEQKVPEDRDCHLPRKVT